MAKRSKKKASKKKAATRKRKPKPAPQKFEGLAENIERVSIDTLAPHPDNPRMHDERNIQAIMRSIDEFKQLAPLVLWGPENWVIVGNGRLEAAKRLGWDEIEIVRADHLSEEQALAYMIADNKTTDLSEFDFQIVAKILDTMSSAKVDLTLTGLAEYEIEPLMQAEWQPPAVDTMPTVSDATAVKFTKEEWETVLDAIEMLREYEGFEKAKDGPALAAICEEWMGAVGS